MADKTTNTTELAEQMGRAQMTLAELVDVIETDDIPPAVLRAYRRGVLLGKLDVQTSIYEMAKQGTAPAQKQYMDLAENAGTFAVDESEGQE